MYIDVCSVSVLCLSAPALAWRGFAKPFEFGLAPMVGFRLKNCYRCAAPVHPGTGIECKYRSSHNSFTKEETAAALVAISHRWRIYTDGGCDDSGNGTESGAAGWGAYIVEVDVESGELSFKAHLWGPMVTDAMSQWWMGSERDTNQAWE